MVTQLTVRDVSVEDVDVLKREAAARHVSLNTVLRDIVAAEAEQIRRRARMKETIRETDALDLADVEAVGTQSMVPPEVRQRGHTPFAAYPVWRLDGRFLAETTYGLSARAEGYEDAPLSGLRWPAAPAWRSSTPAPPRVATTSTSARRPTSG